jgi:deazaflavin-dependent oxidoreductase (nitroreductase family)
MSERPDMKTVNARIIDEFRANGGEVEMFKDIPILLLHHTGAKSSKSYVNPLAYLPDGERLVVFASMGGAPNNPDWYHNLVAHPDVQVEIEGKPAFAGKARVATGAERDALYAEQVKRVPVFAEYQQKTTRVIPVVVIERV